MITCLCSLLPLRQHFRVQGTRRFVSLHAFHNFIPAPLRILAAVSCVWWSWHRKLQELSCTDVFDSSADVSWVVYMCGVDHLPFPVYWTVKPRGHRPTWVFPEAPRSYQKWTRFMKNYTNNVTRAEKTSYPVARGIRFWFYYSSHYSIGQTERLVNTKPKLSCAFSEWRTWESLSVQELGSLQQ